MESYLIIFKNLIRLTLPLKNGITIYKARDSVVLWCKYRLLCLSVKYLEKNYNSTHPLIKSKNTFNIKKNLLSKIFFYFKQQNAKKLRKFERIFKYQSTYPEENKKYKTKLDYLHAIQCSTE